MQTRLEDRILAVLADKQPRSIDEIFTGLGRDCRFNTLAQRLATMAREGAIKRVGTGIYSL